MNLNIVYIFTSLSIIKTITNNNNDDDNEHDDNDNNDDDDDDIHIYFIGWLYGIYAFVQIVIWK